MRFSLIALSDRGIRLAETLRMKAGGKLKVTRCEAQELPLCVERERSQADVLLLLCDMENAVRSLSSLFQSDTLPPIVIQIDEFAKYVVPLCPTDSRTAAELTKELSVQLGAIPVVTGTEQVETFAIDKWADAAGLRAANPEAARFVKEKLLCGEAVLYDSVFPITGALPPGIREAEDWEKSNFSVSYLTGADAHTLLLVPPVLSLGIDAEAEADEETLETAAETFMEAHNCHPLALGKILCTAECAARAAVTAFCEKFALPLQIVETGEFESRSELFPSAEHSSSAEEECEKCAVLGMGGKLLVRRFEENGIGFALAALEPEA